MKIPCKTRFDAWSCSISILAADFRLLVALVDCIQCTNKRKIKQLTFVDQQLCLKSQGSSPVTYRLNIHGMHLTSRTGCGGSSSIYVADKQ